MAIELSDFTNFAAHHTGLSTFRAHVAANGETVVGNGSFKQRFGLDYKANRETMAAFRSCLKNEYGVFGEHAFDTVLGSRADTGRTLRASDIASVMRVLSPTDKGAVRQTMIRARLQNEAMRQAETNPRVLAAPGNVSKSVYEKITNAFENDPVFRGQVMSAKTQETLTRLVEARLNALMDLHEGAVGADSRHALAEGGLLRDRDAGDRRIADGLTMGLSGLDEPVVLNGDETSVEDRIRKGTLGAGMSVNAQSVGLVLEKLKTSGVEPGFLARRDWSAADTREMMRDDGNELDWAARAALATILKRPLTEKDDVKALKERHFTEIRDAIRAGTGNVKHLTDRLIVKLDYNEKDRVIRHKAGSVGTFRLPVRNVAKGTFYRLVRVTGADDASVGAVAEALANDLTRAMGVDTQDLTLMKGKYSDGHDKIMLVSKFAQGYRDFNGNFIQDGRLVPKKDADGNVVEKPEDIGRYKAMFLLLADRDAVGSKGQNKGLVNGKFFAIDPGHSLEGSGKDLEIRDDFSFVDHGGDAITKGHRFRNYSVFDDSNRSEKLKGMIQLRKRQNSFGAIFDAYRQRFPEHDEMGRPNALNAKILRKIAQMLDEFRTQYAKLLRVFASQLDLQERVEAYFGTRVPPVPGMGDRVIDAIENLERLNSPTTDRSEHGEVALKHLEVKPETRVPWSARIEPRNAARGDLCDTVVFSCKRHIGDPLKGIVEKAFGRLMIGHPKDGHTEIRVPINVLPQFLNVFTEQAVKDVVALQ